MNKLLKNTSIYTIGNVIPQIAGFFLLPIYTSYLTTADYGIVQSMQVLSAILAILFTLSIDRGVFRLYYDHKDQESRATYLSTIVISLFAISSILLILLFAFNSVVGLIYSSIEFYPFYVYAISTSFFAVFAKIPKVYYQIQEKPSVFIGLSLFQFFVNTALILWFIVVEKAGAEGMLKAYMLGSLAMLPLFIYINIKVVNFKFKFSFLKQSLAFSLPMIPALLAAWILNLSDRILIERFLTLDDLGVYSLGYKIAGLIAIITSALNLAYNPLFYKIANSGDDLGQIKKKLSDYNFLYMIVLFFIIFNVAFFSKELLELLFDKRYHGSYEIVYIISIAFIFSQLSSLFNLSMYQAKQTKVVMYIVITSALINIGLNYFLIPIWGIKGAAISTVLAFMVFFSLKYYYAQKFFPLKFQWLAFIILTTSIIGLVYVFSVVKLSVVWVLGIKIVFVLVVFALIYFKYKNKLILILKE